MKVYNSRFQFLFQYNYFIIISYIAKLKLKNKSNRSTIQNKSKVVLERILKHTCAICFEVKIINTRLFQLNNESSPKTINTKTTSLYTTLRTIFDLWTNAVQHSTHVSMGTCPDVICVQVPALLVAMEELTGAPSPMERQVFVHVHGGWVIQAVRDR